MKKFPVNKNLEREPRIQGYRPNLFYLLFVLQITLLLVFFMWGISVIAHATATNLMAFVIVLGMAFVALLFLRTRFKKLSNQTKYKFGKKRIVLSNRDILNRL